MDTVRLVGDVLCVGVCLGAAYFDIRSRRIPDFLTYPALVVGLLFAAWDGGYSLLGALLGAAVCGGTFSLLAASGGMGWGDVKLMAVVGAWLGWPLASWSAVLYAGAYTALVGGVMGLGVAAGQGRLGVAMKAMFWWARRREKRVTSGVMIPYGVAIGVGTLWAVAARYVPALLIGS